MGSESVSASEDVSVDLPLYTDNFPIQPGTYAFHLYQISGGFQLRALYFYMAKSLKIY